jgi:hypothetical protein
MKNPEYIDYMLKKAFTFKKYILPSGKIIQYQYYENKKFDKLIINEKINESDIITGIKNIPQIYYNFLNNKRRVHFVDIFILSQNRYIEVKSTWTFTKFDVLINKKQQKKLDINMKFGYIIKKVINFVTITYLNKGCNDNYLEYEKKHLRV